MRRDRQRLQDIVEALERVLRAVEGRTEDQFAGNDLLRYAIAQQLTVVGEAAARLSSDLLQKYPLVPWQTLSASETSWCTSILESSGRS